MPQDLKLVRLELAIAPVAAMGPASSSGFQPRDCVDLSLPFFPLQGLLQRPDPRKLTPLTSSGMCRTFREDALYFEAPI
jgi:hypothetical protein